MSSVLEMKEKKMAERSESPTFQKKQRSQRTQVAEDDRSQKTSSGLNMYEDVSRILNNFKSTVAKFSKKTENL